MWGGGISCASFFVAISTFVKKLLHWNSFSIGTAAAVTGIFFLGGVQLIFIGILGEYVLSINSRITRRPLVVEEERINFQETK